MTVRTCDFGEVVGRVGDAVSGRRPVLVAVSGFAASGKTTLAGRLQERISGSAVIGADLLEGTAPLLMTGRQWAATQRDELERRLPERAAAVIVEGRGLLHPSLIHLFGVRVWLDVDLEEATMRGNLRASEQSRRDGGPVGEWRAHGPPKRVAVNPVEAEFFARFRPDRVADVLFVPVGRMTTPIRVRFMTEYGCDFVLWDDLSEQHGELEHLLPMPSHLRQRLLDHADRWYRHDGGEPVPDWPGDEEFDRRGYLLSLELQAAVGPDYKMEYSFRTAGARRWATHRE